MRFFFIDKEMNFTFASKEEQCQVAYNFRKQPKFYVILTLEVLISFVTLVIMCLIFKNRQFKKLWQLIELDLKIVLFVGCVYYVIGTANSFLTNFYKLSTFLIDFKDPCRYVWSGFQCFWANNIYIIICMIASAWFHVALFLERLVATFFDKSKCSGLLGTLLGLGIVVLAPLPQFILFDIKAIDYERVYCGSTISTVASNAAFTNNLFLFGDYIVCGGDFLLFWYNKRQIEKYKKRPHHFDLNESFKLRELKVSCSWIYPFSMVHSATFGIQIFASYNYYTKMNVLGIEWTMFYSETINLSRICVNFIVVAFLYLYNLANEWNKRRSRVMPAISQTDVYFKQFQQMIS